MSLPFSGFIYPCPSMFPSPLLFLHKQHNYPIESVIYQTLTSITSYVTFQAQKRCIFLHKPITPPIIFTIQILHLLLTLHTCTSKYLYKLQNRMELLGKYSSYNIAKFCSYMLSFVWPMCYHIIPLLISWHFVHPLSPQH